MEFWTLKEEETMMINEFLTTIKVQERGDVLAFLVIHQLWGESCQLFASR